MPFRLWVVCGLGLSLLPNACGTPVQRPTLPPSESDLVLLKSPTLCTSKPDFLKTGDAARVKIRPTKPLVIEPFKQFPQMGRFAIRDMGQTVAAGQVIDVEKAK